MPQRNTTTVPSSIDLKSPFAQALISEGQRRGYSPLAVAASIGNASTENGLRTNGAPGDQGTAFGGFQWRGDRYQNLQNTARQMGISWDDPRAQAAHWYNEQDGVYGGEKPYGDALKSARTPQEANDAVIRSLRPAGSQNGPRSAHNYGGRLGAVTEAFNLMNGGDGGVQASPGGPGDDRYGVNPDVPAQGAQEAKYVVPGSSPGPKDGWDSFLSGGPGALFGQPTEGWNVGDALLGAGAAMMARDNPDGAKSLAAMARVAQEREEARRKLAGVTTEISPQTGRAYVYDKAGNVTFKQLHEAQQKPMSDASYKLLQANNDKADTAYNVLEKNQEFIGLLKAGKVDLSALNRMGDQFRTFTNDSDEKTRNAARLQAHLEDMRNARLLDAKGTQTEGDAQRALDSLLPGLSKYDNKTVASLLLDSNKGFESAWDRNYRYNKPLLIRYPDYDPDGYYTNRHQGRLKDYESRKADLEMGWDKFMAPPPVATTSDAPLTGRRQMQGPQAAQPAQVPSASPTPQAPQKPKGSFLEFYGSKPGQ